MRNPLGKKILKPKKPMHVKALGQGPLLDLRCSK
jgi:hypothetical protein